MANRSSNIPKKFGTYDELKIWLEDYERTNGNRFNIVRSKSLYKVYKNRENVDFNPYLIYDQLKYHCSTMDKNEQVTSSSCRATLSLSTSPYKKNLQVDGFRDDHNHPPMILGRRGSEKQRPKLLEEAKKLWKKINPQNPVIIKPADPLMEAVIKLRRVDETETTERREFVSFLETLKGNIDIDSILANKKKINLMQLKEINKDNVSKYLRFDIEKHRVYFEQPALKYFNILLEGTKKVN
ncbi:uncharacterized protein LOC130667498 [Microplitis mediator]|uniref:uncharacterized protein LOC130667498 n=1 Tax=Microplitis mediator TaxID=375433 RepID=UPI00255304C2|nr:uncharacterized protein LOC130667498 [Microplitis mediator]